MGSHALARLRDQGRLSSFAWIANTKEQVEQAEVALAAVGITGGLVCCMMARPNLSDADTVIIDECHHAPASCWSASISTVRADANLWGLSATPFDRDEERNVFLQQLFGDFMFIDREQVLAGGHLVSGRVIPLDLDAEQGIFDAAMKAELDIEVKRWKARYRFLPEFEIVKRVRWQMTQAHLQGNLQRNAMIAQTAIAETKAGEVVIVLVASIEHGETLSAAIPGSVILTSKLPAKLRRQRVDDFRAGKIPCVVATQLLDEGADFPIASVLVLAAGGRSPTKIIQRAGRVMRPYHGKTEGLIYDFVDRGLNLAFAQWKARRRIYRELGYQIEPEKKC